MSKRRAAATGRRHAGGRGENAPFLRFAALAARLRDGDRLTWKEASGRLGVSDQTARRAYRHAKAADAPHPPARRAG